MAAISADGIRGKAAAIKEEYALFLPIQDISYLFFQ
jgi:hypothetical protein